MFLSNLSLAQDKGMYEKIISFNVMANPFRWVFLFYFFFWRRRSIVMKLAYLVAPFAFLNSVDPFRGPVRLHQIQMDECQVLTTVRTVDDGIC